MNEYQAETQIENQLEDAYAEYVEALLDKQFNLANKFVRRMSSYGLNPYRAKDYLVEIAQARFDYALEVEDWRSYDLAEEELESMGVDTGREERLKIKKLLELC